MKCLKLLFIPGIILLAIISLFTCGLKFPAEALADETKPAEIEKGYQPIENNVWCVTFQLVWNNFMDKVNYGKPILLAGGNPPVAVELNKKLYTKDILSADSYYLKEGVISKRLKKQIEKDINKKFKETSDIIGMIDWSAKNSYLFYAMLKKNFEFLIPFTRLDSAPFAGGNTNVKYFGINHRSPGKLRKNVEVIFYSAEDDYAIKLLTKEDEEVILYRTSKKDSFEDLYTYICNQDTDIKFGNSDTLKIPDINIDKTIFYNELCNKKIKGTDKVISQAIQTIKFKMDNKGGTLKSEAAIAVMRTSLMHDRPKNYRFDDEFVIFLKEQNKDKPYFAARIDNTDFLVKD